MSGCELETGDEIAPPKVAAWDAEAVETSKCSR